ncbi:MAG: 2-succinyl-5-enolpyruvyl-6-hydroxy-3-cyclohexene-1-carboxylic-acid synthase [Myxococcales bacterium]|nr:2-succinyl-5-enolpyruvyl-6-hydroxy-3-cyclohexene-1-carboxylic-acid synthase [Myxococcales bacterium]
MAHREPRDPQSEQARLVVATLVADGVTDVVVSPGSRHGPLLLALCEHGGPRLHECVDERAAAFFALGAARATRRPVALLCTSGTAGAHYLPAIVEAAHAFVPLLAITADRPASAQHAGASQTIDQRALYGRFVRASVELPEARPTEACARATRRLVREALRTARGPLPGPVHLDVHFDKPLEPRAASDETERAFATLCEALAQGHAALPPARMLPDPQAVRDVAALLARSRRPLLVAGPLAPGERLEAPIAELMRRLHAPLLAELTSQLAALATSRRFDLWLAHERARQRLRPDVVVQLGATPTSGQWDAWVGSLPADVALVLLCGHGPADPHGRATHVLYGEPRAALEGLLESLPSPQAHASGELRDVVRKCEVATERVVERELATAPFSEGHLARALLASLPPGSQLVVGNSLPIRDVDAFGGPAPEDLAVLSQRGTSGIDGLVAASLGAAAVTRRPTAAFVGDLSLLHDVGSLVLAQRLDVPLAIVVAANGGGRIFETLPVAHHRSTAPWIERWTTPQRWDIGQVARGFGVAHVVVEDEASARSGIGEAMRRPGATLVEARLAAHGAAAQRARVARTLSEVL